jgi:hypothetical protein
LSEAALAAWGDVAVPHEGGGDRFAPISRTLTEDVLKSRLRRRGEYPRRCFKKADFWKNHSSMTVGESTANAEYAALN